MKKRHCVVITVYKDVNMRRCLLNTLHDKNGKRTLASTCSYALFSAIIVSHDTESKKLSTIGA